MSRRRSPARALLRTLRTGLSTAQGTDRSPLVLLARQALTFIEQGAPGDPDTSGDAGELAYFLAALLATDLGPLAGQALGLLFRLGVAGEILAAAHLETLPEEAALLLLADLGDEEKLLFVNAFFRRDRPDRPRLTAFCQGVVTTTAESAPDELLVLLDLLASRQELPTLPLRNFLIRGRLGIWLQRLLLLQLSADQARYLASVIGRLRDPELAERLAARIDDMDGVTAEIVCRALAEIPGFGAWTATSPLEALLADEDPLLAIAALGALARCDEPRAVRSVAALATAKPGRIAELAPALAGFSQAGFKLMMQTVPPDLRPELLRSLYAVLASALPGRLLAAARAIRGREGAADPVFQALLDDLASRSRRLASARPKRPGRGGPGAPGERPKGVRDNAGLGADEQAAALADGLCRELSQAGAALHDRTIVHVDLDGQTMTDVSFSQCRLQGVRLAGMVLTGGAFETTRFSNVDFGQAQLANIVFRNCRFDNCRFVAAVLQNIRFIDCRLRFCSFGDATGRQVVFEDVDAEACNFDRAAIAGLTLARSWFRAVNLTRATLANLQCRGTAFTDCLFESAAVSGAVLAGVTTDGCYFAHMRLAGATDAPDILAAVAQEEAQTLADASPDDPLPDILAIGPGLRLVAAVLDAAFCARDIRHRRLALLANNKRRLALTRNRLGANAAAFLEILPGLVAVGAVRDESGIRQAPAARIAGYHATLPARRLLTGHFGGADSEALPPTGETVAIEAIYSIGSVGTVAQTTSSDLDVWICLDAPEARGPQTAAFQEKLAVISRMAEREHGLEVHFFCMTAQDIRDNVFGFSEDEGQGSAQGCLLKEEFYRTVLVVAGRKPAWWCVAPGAEPDAYGKTLTDLARTEPEVAADSLDCGSVGAIAGDEYFGASLWMIVKSLTSPFKSILKFGLLEKYAEQAARPELLCETLKAALITGQNGLWQCDPYALLFAEISRYYGKREQAGALALLRKAFQQKTGFDPCGEFGGRSGESMLDQFFPYTSQAAGICPTQIQQKKQTTQEDDFAQVLALGDAITKYFLHVYKRLRQQAAGLPSQGGLTERDQTMLSQRIAASFGRRAGKIMRLPFIRPGRDIFVALEVDHDERTAGEGVFAIRGEPGAKGEDKTEKWESVHADTSLPRLAAWLSANEIYRPGMNVNAVILPPPLSLPDVIGLFDAVHAAFPIRETFAPPLSWGLAPKTVTAALIVLNLHTPREERDVVRVDVLYATSWGELLHLGKPRGIQILEKDVAAFLTKNLDMALAQGARIKLFAPARSQCRAARQARFGR